MEQVTLLRQDESARLDLDRIDELFLQLGNKAAEDIVCRALEELAARLAHIDACFRKGEMADIRKSARGLGAIADQLGMMKLAGVARDVALCAECGDPVAQAATLARLLRVGERSLTELWDMQDS